MKSGASKCISRSITSVYHIPPAGSIFHERPHIPEIGVSGEKARSGNPYGECGLCRKQKDLRAGNEGLFRLADLENKKYQNRYYVTGEKLSLSHNLTVAAERHHRCAIKLHRNLSLKGGKKQDMTPRSYETSWDRAI